MQDIELCFLNKNVPCILGDILVKTEDVYPFKVGEKVFQIGSERMTGSKTYFRFNSPIVFLGTAIVAETTFVVFEILKEDLVYKKTEICYEKKAYVALRIFDSKFFFVPDRLEQKIWLIERVKTNEQIEKLRAKYSDKNNMTEAIHNLADAFLSYEKSSKEKDKRRLKRCKIN